MNLCLNDNDPIKVWKITNSHDDHQVIVRPYQTAVGFAQNIIECLMDDAHNIPPLSVTVEIVDMTVGEYKEIISRPN